MSIFSFVCSDGHETEWLGSRDARPNLIPCRSCSGDAVYRPAISKHIGVMGTMAATVTEARGNAHEFSGVANHAFRCQCGEEFEDIVDFGLNEKTSDGKPCPKCGLVAVWIPAMTIDRSSERYPYFDRGLGMRVDSKSHRADICRFPRKYGINSDGLIPVDGDWDAERAIGKMEREHEESEKRYNAYTERLATHPGFRDFRRARDQGRF